MGGSSAEDKTCLLTCTACGLPVKKVKGTQGQAKTKFLQLGGEFGDCSLKCKCNSFSFLVSR